MNSNLDVRPSPIAGTWYASDPRRLRAEIETYLAAAQLPALDGSVMGVITPHAGYRYSGKTAAHAFRAVQGRSIDLVAVVAPMHQFHPETLLTTAHAAYATPLGTLEVDRAGVDAVDAALRESGLRELTAVRHDQEHALEIELPFLQVALDGAFRLLPLMVRSQDPRAAEALGNALARALAGRNALLVASTDLSHFYPQPVAERLDQAMLARIGAFSPEGVLAAEHSGEGYACGAAAVSTVLWAARALGGDQVVLLDHSTSADVTGDTTSVVGYGAAAILKRA